MSDTSASSQTPTDRTAVSLPDYTFTVEVPQRMWDLLDEQQKRRRLAQPELSGA